MNAELLQEVPLASEAGLRPVTENPPTVSFPPVISTQFTVLAVISSPQSSGQATEAEIQVRWANLPPLKKSYPGHRPQQIGFQRELMYQNQQSKILKLLSLNSLISLGQALVFHNRQCNHLQMWTGLLQFLISLIRLGFLLHCWRHIPSK